MLGKIVVENATAIFEGERGGETDESAEEQTGVTLGSTLCKDVLATETLVAKSATGCVCCRAHVLGHAKAQSRAGTLRAGARACAHSILGGQRIVDRVEYTGTHVLLIDETGKNLGPKLTGEALDIAEERGVVLVEVNAHSKPPVCRLVVPASAREKDRAAKDKVLFDDDDDEDEGVVDEYAERETFYVSKGKIAAAQKTEIRIKEVRFGVKTTMHDIENKVAKCKDFISKGYRVHMIISATGQGRKPMQELIAMMKETLATLLEQTKGFSVQEGKATVQGRRTVVELKISPEYKEELEKERAAALAAEAAATKKDTTKASPKTAATAAAPAEIDAVTAKNLEEIAKEQRRQKYKELRRKEVLEKSMEKPDAIANFIRDQEFTNFMARGGIVEGEEEHNKKDSFFGSGSGRNSNSGSGRNSNGGGSKPINPGFNRDFNQGNNRQGNRPFNPNNSERGNFAGVGNKNQGGDHSNRNRRF